MWNRCQVGWIEYAGAALGLGFAVVALCVGCMDTPDEYLGDDQRGIVALFPDDGAAGVPEDVIPFVDVGWDVPDDVGLHASLVAEDGEITELQCALHPYDRARRECWAPGGLQADTGYTLIAELTEGGTGPVTSRFTTSSPHGPGYEVGTTMTVHQFGGEGTPEEAVEALADGTPAVLVRTADQGTTATGAPWVWGPGKELEGTDEHVVAVQESVGYAFVTDSRVEPETGEIHGGTPHAFLPIRFEDDWHFVRLDQLVVQGSAPAGGDAAAVELTYEALLPMISIERLSDRIGYPLGNLVMQQVDLDVDTDGNGVVDAARLVFSTRAEPVEIHQP